MLRALIFTLMLGSALPLVAKEEHMLAVKNAAMLITAVPVSVAPMSTSVNAAVPTSAIIPLGMMPLPLEEATKMSGLRLTALITGIAALIFTFYQALGRRPNSSRR